MENHLNESEKIQIAANTVSFICNGMENLRLSLSNNNKNNQFDESLQDIERAQRLIKNKMLELMNEAGEWANGLSLNSEVDMKIINPSFEVLEEDLNRIFESQE